jgi:hypothetical protein
MVLALESSSDLSLASSPLVLVTLAAFLLAVLSASLYMLASTAISVSHVVSWRAAKLMVSLLTYGLQVRLDKLVYVCPAHLSQPTYAN